MSMTHNNTNGQSVQAKADSFMDSLMLNTILRELSPELRREFTDLIDQERYEEAQVFVSKYIPDLENKLSDRMKELFNTKVS
jgi:hypothetical protein